MKALVTGGAGFIGSHIVDRLVSNNINVVVLDNFSSGSIKNLKPAFEIAKKNNITIEIIEENIENTSIWSNIPKTDGFFHLAAQTSVTRSANFPKEDFSINVNPILFILDYIKQSQVKYFLYANTAGALYGNAQEIPTSENHPLHPESPYGATKSFLETYLRATVFSQKADGIFSSDVSKDNYFSWASLRLANVYGPRQISKGEAGVVPIFLEKFLKGQNVTIFGDGNKTRDYIFVKDVADAFYAAFEKMQSQCIDSAFNLGTGVETKDIDLFNLLYKAALESGRYPEVVGSKTPKFAEVRSGEVLRAAIDCSKLGQLIPLTPFGLLEGLENTVKSFLVDFNSEDLADITPNILM